MKFKRNLFFPAVLLLVIVGMTAIAAPVVMQKYGDSQSWSQKNVPGSTPGLRQQGSQVLPNTGLQGQVAQAASSDCTYTFVYWKDHPEQWPDSLKIGQSTVTKQQAGNLFQSDIGIDPAAAQKPIQYLEVQAYISTLNINQGSSPYEIQQTLTEASNWLAQNQQNSANSSFDGSVGLNLALNLEDYNNGFTGPGLCPNQPPFPKLTATPTNSPSPVPTQTPAPHKSQTINQQPQQDQKQNGQNPPVAPTKPPQPTATPQPPTATPAPPTATQAPPTNTPRPTSEPPVPPRDPQPPPDKPKPPGKPPKPPGKPPKPKPTKIPKGSGSSQVFPSFFG